MNPSQAESDAMAAFLALSEGSLMERAEAWLKVIEETKKQMQEKESNGCSQKPS